MIAQSGPLLAVPLLLSATHSASPPVVARLIVFLLLVRVSHRRPPHCLLLLLPFLTQPFFFQSLSFCFRDPSAPVTLSGSSTFIPFALLIERKIQLSKPRRSPSNLLFSLPAQGFYRDHTFLARSSLPVTTYVFHDSLRSFLQPVPNRHCSTVCPSPIGNPVSATNFRAKVAASTTVAHDLDYARFRTNSNNAPCSSG